jgi:thiol-disulfide isomerase/thioredoxin
MTGSILLAACGASSPSPPPEKVEIPASPSAVLTQVLDEEPSITPTEESPPITEVLPTVTEKPEVRTDLHASNPSDFELASGNLQLVEFFAFWWPTCRAIAPIVHGLEADYGDQVNFVYLDIDDSANDDFKQALGYRYQPHILLLDEEGEVLSQWVGPITKEDLESSILSHLES